MTVKAIIHTASRVIKRITSDASPLLAADETAVLVASDFDLSGGPWKLAEDGVTKVAPTEADLDAAFTPPTTPELQNVLDLLATASTDAANSASTQAVFAALHEALKPRRVL